LALTTAESAHGDGFIRAETFAVTSPMATEYEELLRDLIDERRAKLDELLNKQNKTEKDKQVKDVVAEMRFIEVELQRFREGLALFRTKNIPKVGRWGKPETEAGHGATGAP